MLLISMLFYKGLHITRLLITDAFDYLSHNLLIAKLHAYGLDIDSLNILQDYLSNRENKSGFCLKLLGSNILWSASRLDIGPLKLIIFMCHMFLTLKSLYVTGYGDDNKIFMIRNNITDMIKALD